MSGLHTPRHTSQGEKDFVPFENCKTNLRAVREITTHKTTFRLRKMCSFTVFTEFNQTIF